MLITQIHSNVHDSPLPDGTHVEKVTLPSAQLVKRIQRLRTDHGTEVGLRLPAGSPDLKDGDVLSLEAGKALVVQVEASDVLVISPTSMVQMAVTAHTLGNRHLQAQFFGADSEYAAEVMVVQYDHTVESYLVSSRVPFQRQDRVMPVAFRHSEHTH